MPKHAPEPTIKVHKRFDREEWGWRANGIDQHFVFRPVGHYTLKGNKSAWRLLRREIWTNGVREIAYVLNHLLPSGDWDNDIDLWPRRPAFAKVRTAILRSLVAQEQALPERKRWTARERKARIKNMLRRHMGKRSKV